MAWRSIAAVDMPGLDGVRFWLGTDRFFGLCLAGGDLVYGFGNITCARAHDPVAGRRSRLARGFTDFPAPVRQFITAIATDRDVHCAPIDWLPCIAWGDAQLVLIGDAAHAMSPMMGQGGGMAIEDAVVLAEELRRHGTGPEAFAAFTARRTPRVTWVHSQSAGLSDLVGLPQSVRDLRMRERGAAAFKARYAPLREPA